MRAVGPPEAVPGGEVMFAVSPPVALEAPSLPGTPQSGAEKRHADSGILENGT